MKIDLWINANHILEYYRTCQSVMTSHHPAQLAVTENHQVVVCYGPTAEECGWDVILHSNDDRLDLWLDGAEMTRYDAERFAEEINQELDHRNI